MPDFTMPGDPGGVRDRAAVMRSTATTFASISVSLAAVSTSGWSGRAADRFRDRFEVEPGRWQVAADGFVAAAGALEGWASTLEWAQERGRWCAREWARGESVSAAARSRYDADVAAARRREQAWEAANGAGTYTLTIEPFSDPGEAIRENAQSVWAATVAEVDAAAGVAAGGVRAGCVGAPEKRNWLESGLAFVGGIFAGAGEAVWDLGSMLYHLGPVDDLISLATGDLTPEELAATYELKWETAQGLWTALTSDPWEFGKTVGKSVLDWDTWSDDPARALGHLVPDAVAAVFTGGSSAALTRGGSALGALGRHADDIAEGLVDAGRVADGLDDVRDATRVADGLDDLHDLDKLDDLGDTYRSHLFDESNPFSIRNLIGDEFTDAEYYRQRIEAGNEFNRVNYDRYPLNEITLENGKRLDSLDPGDAIVSRKHTDLNLVRQETAFRYIDEAVTKYSPGEVIKDTPANRAQLEAAGLERLIGKRITGVLKLEVPPHASIPESILRYAHEKRVQIIDPTGRNYTAEWKASQ